MAAAKKSKLLILDVDGVMTDGSIILDNNDNEIKVLPCQKTATDQDARQGRGTSCDHNRALFCGCRPQGAELGIDDVYQRCYVKDNSLTNSCLLNIT